MLQPNLVEIDQLVLEKKIFINFVNVFSLFHNYLPLGKAQPFIWTNLNPLHPNLLCAKFGWNRPSGSGDEDFWILSMCFPYFIIISPQKRVGSFIWIILNPLYPRMLCAKFGWNWPSGSGEEDENVKSLQRQRQQHDENDKQRTNFYRKSSAQVS